MSSDLLRLILLVIGLGVILAIYLAGQAKRRHERQNESFLELEKVEPRLDREVSQQAAETVDSEPVIIPELSQPLEVDTPAPPRSPAEPEPEPEPPAATPADPEPAAEAVEKTESSAQPATEIEIPAAEPERLIILHIKSNTDGFSGAELSDAFAHQRLVHDARWQSFHYLDASGRRPIFSVTNMLKPGHLDPGQWDGFTTPGISLFAALPGPLAPLDTLERLHRIAKAMATELGGVVLDDRREVLTAQKLDYLRTSLQEYQRKSHLHAKS